MTTFLGEAITIISTVTNFVTRFVIKSPRLSLTVNISELIGYTPDGDSMLAGKPLKVSIVNPSDKDVELDSYWIEWGKSKWFTRFWKKDLCPAFDLSGDEIEISKIDFLAKARRRIFFETEVIGLEYWLSGEINDIKAPRKIWARIAILDIHNNWHKSKKFELDICPRKLYR